jgi:pullulanase
MRNVTQVTQNTLGISDFWAAKRQVSRWLWIALGVAYGCLLPIKHSHAADNETLFQYFEWYLPDDGKHWDRLRDDAVHLRDVGFSSVWIPPPYKGEKTSDVGYGAYDWYDLGEFNQKGAIRTKYGTRTQLEQAIAALHAATLKVYGDVVMNHKGGADATETVSVNEMDWNNRNNTVSGSFNIQAWTKFDYAVRANKYSSFKWNKDHFDGVDWNEANRVKKLYRFVGKTWDSDVDTENGNYDYLLHADVDYDNAAAANEMKSWGVWYMNTLGLDGFRIDAVKHIKASYMKEWVDHVRAGTGKNFFAVGEYWHGDVARLESYLNRVPNVTLFDVALHYRLQQASNGSGGFDMRTLFDGTLMKNRPASAVTFVDNHDTQPGQALESWVMDWFKPLAYTAIMTREQGTPMMFYGDYYGISNNNISGKHAILDKIIKARKVYAYGKQNDYLDHADIIGWSREGDASHVDSGLAALISDGPSGTKAMVVGAQNAGEVWFDITGNRSDTVTIGSNGIGDFKVNGGSHSIWVKKSGNVVVDTTPPTIPSNLESTGKTDRSITLQWNGSTDNAGISGYDVLRNSVKIAFVNATSYTDTGLSPSTSYTYAVRAVDTSNLVSGNSVVITVQTSTSSSTNDTQAPTAPFNLTGGNVTASSLTLQWIASSDNAGIAGYDVYRNNTKISAVTTTSFNDTGLTPKTLYKYTVKARDISGNESAASNEVVKRTRRSASTSGNGGLTVHFKKPADWNAVNVYAWYVDAGKLVEPTGVWSGKPMVAETNGWYRYTFTGIQRELGMVFNDGGTKKTGDLKRSSEGWYDISLNSWSDVDPASSGGGSGSGGGSSGGGSTGQSSADRLGAVYTATATTFSLWSPDSANVILRMEGKDYAMSKVADFNGYTGVYQATVPGDWHLKKYQFVVNGRVARDPYGVMVAPGTDWNVVVDLSKTSPTGGWAAHPTLVEREDSVIYEVHVRDFTLSPTAGVDVTKRGKFKGMVQTGTRYNGLTTGIDHLKEMGVTHVQILPFYDFASCSAKDPQNTEPCYNWGYDPENFNVPEERYAMNPEDYVGRIKELKETINEFHKHGIRVIMDVVYNHTAILGGVETLFGPISKQYFWSSDLSGTGNATNPRVPMVSRFIRDSLEYWVKEYHIDGFRFDLIGVFDYSVAGEWAQHLNTQFAERNLLIYGEPWNGYATDTEESKRVRLGTVGNLVDQHVGVFNPKFREALKGENDKPYGAYIFNELGTNSANVAGVVNGIKGSLRVTQGTHPIMTWDPLFANDPEQTINYVSAHDNWCLWDKINAWGNDKPGDQSQAYLARIQRFANAIILTSQGVPFIHAGDEMLRTKNGDHNSYKSSDAINQIDWSWKEKNKAVNDYHTQIIQLRRAHPAFRMNTWQEVNSNVQVSTMAGAGRPDVVVTRINGSAQNDAWKDILMLYVSGDNYTHVLPTGDWKVAVEKQVGNAGGRVVNGSISVEGTAMTILYR